MYEEIGFQQKKIADVLWDGSLDVTRMLDTVKPDDPKLLHKLTVIQDRLEEVQTRINGIALTLAQQEEPYEEMKIHD